MALLALGQILRRLDPGGYDAQRAAQQNAESKYAKAASNGYPEGIGFGDRVNDGLLVVPDRVPRVHSEDADEYSYDPRNDCQMPNFHASPKD